MPYATAADLRARLGDDRYLDLADRGGDGVADDAAVAAALENASSLADSYLARYLPIATPYPASLRKAILDLATHELTRVPSEADTARYKAAMTWLRDAAGGKVALASAQQELEEPGQYLSGTAEGDWTTDGAGGLL